MMPLEGWSPDDTKQLRACTAQGCTETFGRSSADSYYSRPVPDGWISGTAGWRCRLHHDYEITFEQAIENVTGDHYAVESEFGSHAGSDIDWEATLRALRRGPEPLAPVSGTENPNG